MSNIVVVLGSWGSGTSAAVGALEMMGCNTCPPHFKTNDPRTPNSFEPLGLRNVIIPNFDEYGLKFSGPDRGLIPGFLKQWLARAKMLSDKPLAVKLPHLCFFVPEMVAAWEPLFIMVERPLEQIEASRLRRGWPPHLGAIGAEVAYAAAYRDLKNLNQDFLAVSYADLTKNSEHAIDQIADWAGLSPAAEAKAAAADWVAR